MADHVASTTVSPKVTWPAVAMVGATLLVAFLTGITPDMLVGLGQWAVPVFMAIGSGVGILTGYLKSDPLRHSDSVEPATAT